MSDAQPVTVTYKIGGGTVRGNIEACGSARVLLIPQDTTRRRGDFILTTRCGQNGEFEFSAVRPGEYYGIAILSGTPSPLYEAALDDELISQASKVSVRSNESTAAEIRLVTRQ
jgi:hypothetical protein